MKRTKHMSSHLGGFNSGASLGGKVSRYRDKQNIYKQGEPAYTLFYIQSAQHPDERPTGSSDRHPGRA